MRHAHKPQDDTMVPSMEDRSSSTKYHYFFDYKYNKYFFKSNGGQVIKINTYFELYTIKQEKHNKQYESQIVKRIFFVTLLHFHLQPDFKVVPKYPR